MPQWQKDNLLEIGFGNGDDESSTTTIIRELFEDKIVDSCKLELEDGGTPTDAGIKVTWNLFVNRN